MKVNSHILSGIMIIVLGIVVMISVFIIHYDYYYMSPNILKTDCVIQDIDVEKYTTTIMYEVDGEEITKKLNLFDSSFKVGSKTEIYYDKDEPIKSYLQCETTFFNMLIVISLIIIATGVYFIIHYFVKRRHYKFLKENGKKIKANISSIENKKFLSFLPNRPSYICASAEIDKNKYNFLSETIYSRVIKYIKDKKIKTLDVYINKEEIGDYYVDISFINSNM